MRSLQMTKTVAKMSSPRNFRVGSRGVGGVTANWGSGYARCQVLCFRRHRLLCFRKGCCLGRGSGSLPACQRWPWQRPKLCCLALACGPPSCVPPCQKKVTGLRPNACSWTLFVGAVCCGVAARPGRVSGHFEAWPWPPSWVRRHWVLLTQKK